MRNLQIGIELIEIYLIGSNVPVYENCKNSYITPPYCTQCTVLHLGHHERDPALCHFKAGVPPRLGLWGEGLHHHGPTTTTVTQHAQV